ncbi:MAG TPA: metal-dependent hydrolase [Anaerolineae bacterium]|nr:metal-dependent hydrolase [Anaerolineae bacterium]HQH37941.1 metal-dependent hydrolase [Anaerolineae bacterium]
MMLAGHLGVSVLAHRYLHADLVPVVVAGVIPDVVDKALCQGWHLMPSGRMWGHTLLGLAVSTVIVRLLWGRQSAWSWAVGYLGHLVADLGGQVPWLYPFVQYDFELSPGLWEILWRKLQNPVEIGLELVLLGWAALAVRGRSGMEKKSTSHEMFAFFRPEKSGRKLTPENRPGGGGER